MQNRVDVTVENSHTGLPIDGATVEIKAIDTGTSDTPPFQEYDSEEDAREDGVLQSAETESVGDYEGTAAFVVAQWVSELEVEVTHDRFPSKTITFRPGTTDVTKHVQLTPEMEEVDVAVSEHFSASGVVNIQPADPVIESLYDQDIDIEISPGETKTFTFIKGRYRFSLQNPPEIYSGKEGVSKNLLNVSSPRVSFTQVDLEEAESPDAPQLEGGSDNERDASVEGSQAEKQSEAEESSESTPGVLGRTVNRFTADSDDDEVSADDPVAGDDKTPESENA